MKKRERRIRTVDGRRVCYNCFKSKPLTLKFFHKKLDGFQHRCKACNKEIVGAWRVMDRERRIRDGWEAVSQRRALTRQEVP